LASDRLGGAPVVSRQDEDLDAHRLQRADRFIGMLLQRVVDGDHTPELAIDHEEHGGLPDRLETLKSCFGPADSDSCHGHQAAVAEEDRVAEDLGSDAEAWNGFERFRTIERKLSL